MKIAVFGASGTIGRALLPALAATHEVVAISRSDQGARSAGIIWMTADATNPEAVRRTLQGVETAYYLVHSLGSSDFERRDLRAAENVANEAARAGVRQLVYLGGLGDESAELSAHLRSRFETGRQLAAGAVPVTTLRAAMVVGRGSAAFETVVALVDRLPAMVCPRWVSTPTQPIALGDIVSYLAAVAGNDSATGRSFDAGGPEVMTYREMIERIAKLRNRHPRIIEIPLLTPRLSSYWLHLVTPVSAPVARPLIEGLRNETVVREHPIQDLVPLEQTSFEQAAREALRSEPDGA